MLFKNSHLYRTSPPNMFVTTSTVVGAMTYHESIRPKSKLPNGRSFRDSLKVEATDEVAVQIFAANAITHNGMFRLNFNGL
jgi:hypothetical protein